MGMCEGSVIQAVLYGFEAWALNARSWKRVAVLEMQTIIGVRYFDRVRNNRLSVEISIAYLGLLTREFLSALVIEKEWGRCE